MSDSTAHPDPVAVTGPIARPLSEPRLPASLREPKRDLEVFAEIVVDDSAMRLISGDDFAQSWDALQASCPWATAFQRRDFVTTWYAIYAKRYRPMVVVGHDSDGRVRAVLPLAVSIDSGALIAAGSHHAEYQGWLSSAADGDLFMRAAVRRLRERFPGASLTFLYLTPGAPLGWTDAASCATRPVSRALLDARDTERGAASLRKKSNRSRLNRLRRAGDVVFERITDGDAFARALDEIIPLYDLRQGAVNGVLPFGDDPLKQPFHEALFGLPDFLHATVLRVGDAVVGAHVGVLDGDTVSLGVFAHAAEHARHSPGKLHLLHLAGLLAEEGLGTLDLTPGTGWKDRFASRHDDALVVRVFFSWRPAATYRLRLSVEAAARKIVLAIGSSPDAVRGLVRRVRDLGPLGTLRAARRRAAVLYTMPAPTARRLFPAADAEAYILGSTEEILLGREGLADALALLERPARAYTRVRDGRLTARGFLTSATKRWLVPEVKGEVALPAGAIGIHVAGDHRRPLLERLLADAATEDGARSVWLAVADDDDEMQALARELGLAPRLRVVDQGRREPSVERLRPSGAAAVALDRPPSRAREAAKTAVLVVARALGLFALARRRTPSELRILCYHGFALHDESAFMPRLFMQAETFGRRMDRLRALGYPVLGLEEALERLDDGTLPPCATVITIDDGPYSVLSRGLEHLVRNELPATLYQTTYYTVNQSPVFRMALQYALWRSPLTRFELDDLVPGTSGSVDLSDGDAVQAAIWAVIEHGETQLDEPGRCRLAEEVFTRLGVDWDELRESRLVGLLTEDELSELLAAGVDLQLHTHRHRFPVDEAAVRREIADNRAVLEPISGRKLEHLCYPSSEYDPCQFPWLRDLGVKSGTTCNTGLNPRGTEPLDLNRILDGECVSQVEFEAEMSGFLELARRFLRRR